MMTLLLSLTQGPLENFSKLGLNSKVETPIFPEKAMQAFMSPLPFTSNNAFIEDFTQLQNKTL